MQDFLHAWELELENHFDEEERLLIPLSKPASEERLLHDHREIRKFARAIRRGCVIPRHARKLGVLLHDHVRWEERIYFPEIEASASSEQLEQLSKETLLLEKRRANSELSPRRGELMERNTPKR